MVRVHAGIAEQFATELTRRTRAAHRVGLRSQHGTDVAQSDHIALVETARHDARGLRRHVCTQSQQAPAGRINQLEGQAFQVGAGADQQRVQVLE